MRFQRDAIVAKLIEQHQDVKDHLLPIADTTNAFAAPIEYEFYRPIAEQNTQTFQLEGELTREI